MLIQPLHFQIAFDAYVKCLKERYDHPCFIQEEHICSTVDAVPVKNSSDKELHCFYDAAIQHCWVLKAAKTDCFETMLTVILQHKPDERTQLKWVEFNSDSVMSHHVLNSWNS